MKPQDTMYTFYAKNNLPVNARALRPEDTPFLVDIFNHMSSESRYRRFHQTLDHVPESRIWREANHIAHYDPTRSFGFIAFAICPGADNIPIGVARYIDTQPGEAEVAISVRDDYQNLGIGKKLMHLLAYQAQKKGYRRLIASIQNDNVAIWRVFQHLPYHIFRTPDGCYASIIIVLTSKDTGSENDQWDISPQPELSST